MNVSLAQKNILLGLTGSIAVYKSADLVRRLREVGAEVRVAMTENAKRFITPLTMQAVSGNPVHDDLFDVHAEAAMGHIELARWADVILIAPATADSMAHLAQGEAHDLLTTLCLATKAPIVLAPAMNQGMWQNILTRDNLQTLKNKNIQILNPVEGSQACGDVGPGRMMEPLDIVKKLHQLFATGSLSNTSVIVTAGPTYEAIDPVRYMTNHSSGKMGYALAQAAHEAGAEVTLISGPVHLKPPERIECIHVTSAEEMSQAVMRSIGKCDIFLSVAAVSDYRPQTRAFSKLHKDADSLQITLVRNPDIVASVAALPNKPYIVGFAAETETLVQNAKAKRERKGMDLIIANQVGDGIGMGSDDNSVAVISANNEWHFRLMAKTQLARQLISLIAKQFKERVS